MVGIAVERAKAHCSDARSAASRGFLAIAWQGVRVNRKMPGNAISLCPNHGPATKPCSLTLDLAGGVSGFQFANGASFVLHGALGPPDGMPPGISSYLVGNLASAAPGTPPAAPRPMTLQRSYSTLQRKLHAKHRTTAVNPHVQVSLMGFHDGSADRQS